jgi:DeoR/GlpR family transcriptional regulator of sugar metabolism
MQMNTNDTLLKMERHDQIKTLIREKGRVTVQELSAIFDVSVATIRRDLEELDSQGLVRRTHGGAVQPEKAAKEPPMLQRINDMPKEKARIGKAAAKLIQDGETIFLGSGSTVIEIARNLPRDIQLTVITNSLPVVNELAAHPGIKLIVIGGMLRQSELSMVGHVAEQAVREFRADKVFIGMYAIDIDCGFTNDFPPETMTDRAILGIAHQVIVVADHSKFGRVSSMLVAPVDSAKLIITDNKIPSQYIQKLQELDIEVLTV